MEILSLTLDNNAILKQTLCHDNCTCLVCTVFLKNDESYLKELCHEIYHEIQTVRADNKLSNLNMYITSQQI